MVIVNISLIIYHIFLSPLKITTAVSLKYFQKGSVASNMDSTRD